MGQHKKKSSTGPSKAAICFCEWMLREILPDGFDHQIPELARRTAAEMPKEFKGMAEKTGRMFLEAGGADEFERKLAAIESQIGRALTALSISR